MTSPLEVGPDPPDGRSSPIRDLTCLTPQVESDTVGDGADIGNMIRPRGLCEWLVTC